MAYTEKQKQAILQKAIKVAKEKKLYFISDVTAYLPIDYTTFWKWGYNKNNELKEILEDNRIFTKVDLRNRWAESNNATLNIALYKLIASDEERRVLADREIVIESETDIPKDIDKLTPQQVDEYYDKLRAKAN